MRQIIHYRPVAAGVDDDGYGITVAVESGYIVEASLVEVLPPLYVVGSIIPPRVRVRLVESWVARAEDEPEPERAI